MKSVIILGIRGVPAQHGGFETFAERLAPYLRDHGFDVTVYCQNDGGTCWREDSWEGVRRIHVPVRASGALGTIEFDIKSTLSAARRDATVLTLGYNTGFLAVYLRLKGRRNLINMDGLEYRRDKYGLFAKAYLWINERLAAWSGNVLIADHPAIADHLATRVRRKKITMIPYGAELIASADTGPLQNMGLEPGRFFTIIARPEPENSILELVTAFSAKARDAKLVVLGNYDRDNPFQAKVLDVASDEVLFAGAIYDKRVLSALRKHSIAYLHGHRVGGTNPSLVEALGAGSAVIAHDNEFNRWVAGAAATYFADIEQCDNSLTRLLADHTAVSSMQRAATHRFEAEFTWDFVLDRYRILLEDGR